MTVEHLLIAYDILAILIGFIALFNTVSWALKTGQNDLGNFSIIYGLFTLMMVMLVLKKYLFVNVAEYSTQTWYITSGVYHVIDYAVIMATLYYFIDAHQFRYGRRVAGVFLVLMLLSDGLIFSPYGAVLDAENRMIWFKTGYWIAGIWNAIAFTCAIALGYWLLVRVWNTEKRTFTIGLLVFASVGYLESIGNFFSSIGVRSAVLTNERGFIYSSIPYVLYGIFLIVYFMRYPASTPVANEEPSKEFLSKYGITDREREIILKVMQGKSNDDIARELVISLATVKTHLHNIYKKIGIDSRFDLLARVRSGQ
jgi:DNA-binding CsgD family transcriptional regulator